MKQDNQDPITRADYAYTWLREKITSFELKPGELLNEVSIAEQLSMSRTPVREAIHLLAADGLVARVQQQRAYVADVSVPDVLQAYEVRGLLEPFAASQAAMRATQEDIRQLMGILGAEPDQSSAPPSRNEIRRLVEQDLEFHNKVLSLSENEVLTRVVNNMRALTSRVQYVIPSSRIVNSWSEHRRIAQAIADADPDEAAEQMRNHLREAQRRIVP